MSTYLETPQDLDRLIENAPSSAVILNEAREGGDALPLSQVLTTLLRGPTRSFTALVGYFGHRVDETAIERYGSVTDPSGFGQVDGEDPAGPVVRESVEENLREGQNFDQKAFRLLAGPLLPDSPRRLTVLELAFSPLSWNPGMASPEQSPEKDTYWEDCRWWASLRRLRQGSFIPITFEDSPLGYDAEIRVECR